MAENDTRFIFMLNKAEKEKLSVLAKVMKRSQAGALRHLINGAVAQLENELTAKQGAQNEPTNA